MALSSWRDRLRPGVFTSPEGKEYPLVGTSYSRARTLRGKAWEYADVDGAYVERRGVGPKSYPLRVLFSGRNCDLEATAFEDAVCEPGFGTLTHPVYGTVRHVAGLGEVTRRDDLIERANEAVVEITFVDSLDSIFPLKYTDPEQNAIASVDSFSTAAAADFAETAELRDIDSIEMTKATIKAAVARVKTAVGSASRYVQTAQDAFNSDYREFSNSLDTLMGAPTDLALQTLQLIQSPARAADAKVARIEGYLGSLVSAFGAIIDSMIGGSDEPSITPDQTANDFAVQDLVSQGALSGMVIASVNNQYPTRVRALSAALELMTELDTLTAWRDKRAEELLAKDGLTALDVGRGYQALHATVVLALGVLVSTGFALRTERRLVLGRNRQMVELAAELYGSVSNETLDKLIGDNNLTGSQILELTAGTEIA